MRSHLTSRWRSAVVTMGALAALAAPAPSQAEPPPAGPAAGEIVRAHEIMARVALLRAEVALVRLELGRAEAAHVGIEARDVSPREAYFMARVVLGKAERLAHDWTGSLQKSLAPVRADLIDLGHVRVAVDRAIERVERVKQALGIPEAPEPDDVDTGVDAAAVFVALLQVSRQLNLLLVRHLSPGDVFQEVTAAVHYAARLLARFDGAERLPAPPPFERRRRPPDVHARLLHCKQLVANVGARSGVQFMHLDLTRLSPRAVPSDVHDLASLISGQLAYLHFRSGDPRTPPEALFPGRKVPSHVFQRAGLLERQLTTLLSQVELHPAWLGR